ncbi:MAG: hypothetical protein IH991_21860 [Planctomycetes bacterium]|nr:hypothetical protein [Planctomycetota bacterium]
MQRKITQNRPQPKLPDLVGAEGSLEPSQGAGSMQAHSNRRRMLTVDRTDTAMKTTLRIPGNWSHPGELIERMPPGFRLTPETLILPDGVEIEFAPMPPDDQFVRIFESSCRRPATADELEIVREYTVNVGLTGPCGSMQAATTMMQAGAAIVRAGAAGVFIDNSGLAHGGGDWIEMAEEDSPDALSFAFVAIVRGQSEVWTMGMHVLGLRDIVMQRRDVEPDGDKIIEVIRYLCSSDKSIDDGHWLADEVGPRFQVVATSSDEFDAASPMHNPFGRLKLVSMKDIAERN